MGSVISAMNPVIPPRVQKTLRTPWLMIQSFDVSINIIETTLLKKFMIAKASVALSR